VGIVVDVVGRVEILVAKGVDVWTGTVVDVVGEMQVQGAVAEVDA
jgi:hypothetical protein